jgi:hypothetical protein
VRRRADSMLVKGGLETLRSKLSPHNVRRTEDTGFADYDNREEKLHIITDI